MILGSGGVHPVIAAIINALSNTQTTIAESLNAVQASVIDAKNTANVAAAQAVNEAQTNVSSSLSSVQQVVVTATNTAGVAVAQASGAQTLTQ